MTLTDLNPRVHSVRMYDKINRKEECISYNSRLLYVDSGDIVITANGESLGHLGSGTLVYIPAGCAYKLRGQYVRMAVAVFDLCEGDGPVGTVPKDEFKPELISECGIAAFSSVQLLRDMESERDELSRMCDIFTAGEGTYLAELSARLKLVLLKVAEVSDEHALPARMTAALGEYIRENIGDEISNTEVAATFGYHPFYISNILKSAKGQTLRQYIISYRLKLACSMLVGSQRSVAEIAEDCGFTDASYFTKTFRQAFGETPKDYRNRFKEDFI